MVTPGLTDEDPPTVKFPFDSLNNQQKEDLLEEAMRLSGWPPLVPTDGPVKRNRYETKRAEFVEELDKMELEGVPEIRSPGCPNGREDYGACY